MSMPRYLEVADDLRRRIKEGEWAEGEALPPNVELGGQYGASKDVPQMAKVLLSGEGLVAMKRFKGTFLTAKGANLRG